VGNLVLRKVDTVELKIPVSIICARLALGNVKLRMLLSVKTGAVKLSRTAAHLSEINVPAPPADTNV